MLCRPGRPRSLSPPATPPRIDEASTKARRERSAAMPAPRPCGAGAVGDAPTPFMSTVASGGSRARRSIAEARCKHVDAGMRRRFLASTARAAVDSTGGAGEVAMAARTAPAPARGTSSICAASEGSAVPRLGDRMSSGHPVRATGECRPPPTGDVVPPRKAVTGTKCRDRRRAHAHAAIISGVSARRRHGVEHRLRRSGA